MNLTEIRIVEKWLREHNRVKSIIDKQARTSKCVTMEDLVRKSGLSEPEVAQHHEVFKLHGYVIVPLERTYCSVKALRSVYEILIK